MSRIIPDIETGTMRTALKQHFPYYTIFMFIVYLIIYLSKPVNYYTPIILDTKYAYEVYRYYSYSLAHYSVAHIVINLYTWFVYAFIVEYESGSLRAFGIHFISILAGSFGVGWNARFTGERLKVLGASGGIYGMLSSIIGDLVLNWNEFSIYKKCVYIAILVSSISSDVATNIVYYNPKISYANHFGGFLGGIGAGLILSKNKKIHTWERKLQIAVFATTATLATASFINLFLLGF